MYFCHVSAADAEDSSVSDPVPDPQDSTPLKTVAGETIEKMDTSQDSEAATAGEEQEKTGDKCLTVHLLLFYWNLSYI